MFAASCSDENLSFFFDIPPPTEAELRAEAERKAAAEREAAAPAGAVAPAAEAQGPPPEIEELLDWSKAEEMLPRDEKGRVEWSKAARQGIIRPRDRIDASDPIGTFTFKYDFYMPGDDPLDDTYFPHSTHTQWIACETCHPKIFPLRGAHYTKSDIKAGQFCGVCHTQAGGATFWLRACERCHPGPVPRAASAEEEAEEEEEEEGWGDEDGGGEEEEEEW